MTPREYLAGLEFHGIKLGLENIRLLLNAAANPERQCPVLHVAGTNGKGSVVAFIDAILRAAGYTSGRFTSPHLIDVTERFLVNGEPISNGDLDRRIEQFREIANGMPNPPTYFEMCTAIAFAHFAASEVDAAIIEVGMGGRFDSTNVVAPVACAITNISLDHTRYLGDTIEAIAFEKAGIIKRCVPVVVGATVPEAQRVIEATAKERGAKIVRAQREFTFSAGGTALAPTLSYCGPRFEIGDAPLALSGRHQAENAAVAIAVIEQAHRTFARITDSVIHQALRATRWPCRIERVLNKPPVYIDVAHNPAGVARLVEALPRCLVVLSVSSDKDASAMVRQLEAVADQLILTQFAGPRALCADALAQYVSGQHVVCRALSDAIRLGMDGASNACPLLITGSIFAAGQARKILIDDYGAAPIRF